MEIFKQTNKQTKTCFNELGQSRQEFAYPANALTDSTNASALLHCVIRSIFPFVLWRIGDESIALDHLPVH